MSKKSFATPFLLWIICGTVIPLAVVAYYGFTDRSGTFTFANLIAMLSAEHAQALLLSLLLSLISTVICFVIAFPLALILKGSKLGRQDFMVFIFILPMWMNFLLRTMAWQVILEKGGLINGLLGLLHLPPLALINTPAAIVLGMVYDFLPFMVLPIYNTLMKIDDHIIEAAYDLGATKRKVLTDILLPLSIPGIGTVPDHFCNLQHAGRRENQSDWKYHRAGIYDKFQLESGLGPVSCHDGIYCYQHGSAL